MLLRVGSHPFAHRFREGQRRIFHHGESGKAESRNHVDLIGAPFFRKLDPTRTIAETRGQDGIAQFIGWIRSE